MEKLEIDINARMVDDGPVPTDLRNVGNMSCAIAWKGYKASKGSRQERTDMDSEDMASWRRS